MSSLALGREHHAERRLVEALRLERLEVVDFRNHPRAAVELPEGVCALVGRNGVGKTNLLEAIGFLATLGSHRLGQEAALVRAGADAAVVRARAVRAGRRIRLEVELRPGSGVRARLNQASLPRSRDVLGIVRAVVFAPEDIALVRGDPDERRRFLDTLAIQRRPAHQAVRQDYDRILRQRNTLLRSAGGRLPAGNGVSTLDVWDDRLATSGAEVWLERLRLVRLLAPEVQRAYQQLAPSPVQVSMEYAASVTRGARQDDGAGAAAGARVVDLSATAMDQAQQLEPLAEAIRARLRADRRREVERGVTLSGPHRDDLALALDGLPARTHASQGEAWSLALALRMASYRVLAAEGEEPILLLDDVFAELDQERRARVGEAAVAAEQAIVTTAVPEDLPSTLNARMFHVEPGLIRAEGGDRL